MARILQLDDSTISLTATRLALEAAGHEVRSTSDAPAFFASLESFKPDLALVDVAMPMLEGDSVVWIARAHQLRACRIVLYSAKSEAELERLARSSGADGFICKTADEALLRQRVEDELGAIAPGAGG